MPIKVDLHTHTNFSDGHNSPEDLIKLAKSKGINILGIVDHDTVDGLEEAIHYGQKYGVEVIPGIEISTDIDNKEVHLLGYFVDYKSKEFLKYLTFFKKEREFRIKRIITKLNSLGVDISFSDVKKISGNSAMARPHVAFALMEKGVVSDFYAAFRKYLHDNGPAYERKIHFSPSAAIKLIKDAGGLSFVAHPNNMDENILKALIDSGIDGIEVIHPSHSKYRIKFHRGIADQFGLLKSGGSDFHGGKMEDEKNLGKYTIPLHFLNDMKKSLGRDVA
ncbi:MAG: PHP domain-containing protein [Ignavibacteria bacterium]|nr:MAG: PHP domain-containing protein [Ignavibacteria bacterium]